MGRGEAMNSLVLEVAVGLALLYYVTATLVSGAAEGLTRLANVRSKTLWAALARMLAEGGSATTSLGVPFVARSLFPGGGGRPLVRSSSLVTSSDDGQAPANVATTSTEERLSELAALPSIRSLDYVTSAHTKVANIPGKVFASALMELATLKSNDESIQDKLTTLANHYQGSPLGTYLATLTSQVGYSMDRVTDDIGSWFDAQMVRVSQTYRKNIKYVLAVLGLLVALACNIDSMKVADSLRSNSDLRQVVVATAGTVQPEADCTLNPPESDPTLKTLKCGLQDLTAFDATGVVVPLTNGWTDRWKQSWTSNTVAHVLGLALTTGAIALGGPMWFDFLMLLAGRKKSG
jgi:hypothetical protein